METIENFGNMREQHVLENIEKLQRLIEESEAQVEQIETDPKEILEKMKGRLRLDIEKLGNDAEKYQQELSSLEMETIENFNNTRKEQILENIEKLQRLIEESEAQVEQIETDPKEILEKMKGRLRLDIEKLGNDAEKYQQELSGFEKE